jgi:hypothetical protein
MGISIEVEIRDLKWAFSLSEKVGENFSWDYYLLHIG